MELYVWKYCIKYYKNRIIGIKENNLVFFYNLRLFIKRLVIVFGIYTYFFFFDIIVVMIVIIFWVK